MSEKPAPLADADIPLGGGLWRRASTNGMLTIGSVLLAVHVLVISLGAYVAFRLDQGLSSEGRETAETLGEVALYSTIFVPLLATCFLFIGDLTRRGRIQRARGGGRGTVLPQGSNEVDLRMLPLSWHAVWIGVSLGVTAVLVWCMHAAGDWLWHGGGGLVAAVWLINGLIASGVAGSVVGSFVKKVVYRWTADRIAARRAEFDALHPARQRQLGRPPGSSRFWRWFSYRWRLDLWLCAFGMIGLWLFVTLLVLPADSLADASTMADVARWVAPLSVVLLCAGLASTTQFWRAGEELASGESVA